MHACICVYVYVCVCVCKYVYVNLKVARIVHDDVTEYVHACMYLCVCVLHLENA